MLSYLFYWLRVGRSHNADNTGHHADNDPNTPTPHKLANPYAKATG
jgi:hypothetical protein